MNVAVWVKHCLKESKLIKEYLLFVFSAILFNGGKFLVELIAAKRLGPQDYGVWSTMFLVITYATNLHFGVLNGLGREIPFNMAKKNAELIEDFKLVGLRIIFLTIFIFSILMTIYTSLKNYNDSFSNNPMLLIIYFVGYQLYQYFQYILRAELNFNSASIQQGITGIFIILIAIPMVYKWGLNGLIIGYAMPLLIGVLFFNGKKDIFSFTSPPNSKDLFYRLLKVGFPIMAIGFLYTVITSIDRWIVVTFLGAKDMGFYSFAYNIFLIGMLFISLLATQFYSRLVLEYGKNESKVETTNLLKKQITLTIIISTFFSLIALCALPFLISKFVPKYESSLHVAQILLIGLPFLGISLSISGYFNVITKQQYLLIPMVTVALTNFLISLFLINVGFGKEGVAIGTVISYIIYSFLLFLTIRKHAGV